MRTSYLAPLVALLVACGGPSAQAIKDAANAKTSSPELEHSDPLCGAGWKWSGDRCTHTEEPAGGSTTAKLDDLPPPPRSGAFNVEDTLPGDGPQAKPGSLVRVHYTGKLADGSTFDSSKPRGQPFEFRLGQGQVIKGFERGVVGMKVGGTRKVTIPPELGYGRRGVPPQIPPNATLTFEIELLEVKP